MSAGFFLCKGMENKYYNLCVGWLWRVFPPIQIMLFFESSPTPAPPQRANHIDVAQITNFWKASVLFGLLNMGFVSRSKVEWEVFETVLR